MLYFGIVYTLDERRTPAGSDMIMKKLQSMPNHHKQYFVLYKLQYNMYIENAYRQPTFLYESIWCILGFIVLMIIRKYIKKKGIITSIYLIWYGIGRFVIEAFRTDSLMFFIIKQAQIISVLSIILGIVILIKKNNL